MNKIPLYTTAILATFSLTGSAFAQSQQQMPVGAQHNKMPMNSMMQNKMMNRPAFVYTPPTSEQPLFNQFPTPEELARITPPAPMTEEKISKHFSRLKSRMEKTVAQDRKAAEKYAKDFARFQKHQADQLAKIMANAEKQREAMIKRVAEREKLVLEKFRKHNKSPEPAQY